jgi:hypothetical protein
MAVGFEEARGICNEPVIESEPVNLWVSSIESPNFVEPLSNMIEAETNSV